jgi:hypothetical protein
LVQCSKERAIEGTRRRYVEEHPSSRAVNQRVLWKDKVWQEAGDSGINGSEGRVKSQRHVVNELAFCLPVLLFLTISLTEAKDDRPARKGVND